ncbi:lipoprotein [Streptomyces sulfonofaciens]|uniref:Lipoprotein n=2 Tax=Streptomyces sulfonofaciens TaxID=68272 RepID=A0A919FRZ5_9ACTN|nr:lipoprotein [Streptomyces sulfonofaciens]
MGSMSDAPSAAASQDGHNAQDLSFARGMLPHHRQAVAMAQLAPSRAGSDGVKDLAEKIRKAQDPEIRTMSGWLRAWGEKVPDGASDTGASGTPSMPGMDHSGPSAPGMRTGDDMAELKELSGTAFDTAFLRMMIGHHRGAVEMARTEQTKGAYGPAMTMAQSIVDSQSAEIEEMKRMLGTE